MNPYRVLGVSENATPEEIKRAYKKLVKTYHPDLHPNDPYCAEKMNEINVAYDKITHTGSYASNSDYGEDESAGSTSYSSSRSNSGNSSYGNSSYGRTSSGGSSDYTYDTYRRNRDANNHTTYTEGFDSSNVWSEKPEGKYVFFGIDLEYLFGFGFYSNSSTFGNGLQPQPNPNESQPIKDAISKINYGDYKGAFAELNKVPGNYRDGRWYYLYAVGLYGYEDVPDVAIEYIKIAVKKDTKNLIYRRLLRRFRREVRESAENNSIMKVRYIPLAIIGIYFLYMMIKNYRVIAELFGFFFAVL